jgi:hypothetical protein
MSMAATILSDSRNEEIDLGFRVDEENKLGI